MNLARFLTSWLLTSALMFGMFYWWHGVFLNDFAKLGFPLEQYLGLLGVVYLIVGLVLYGLIAFLDIAGGNARKGVLLGGVLGFFIYLIAFSFGVSFHPNPDVQHLAIDFVWQMAEQAIGGLMCGLVYGFFSTQMELKAKALRD